MPVHKVIRHERLRERVREQLAANGVSDDPESDGIHSWRCAYYRTVNGPCSCLESLVDDLVGAVEGVIDDGTVKG